MDKSTKKSVIILLLIVALLVILCSIDVWYKRANKFVYEKHLEDMVLSVDGREYTLRQMGYYVYEVEKSVDKQARIYNPDDPLDYWNTHFSAGLESAYVSEMALDAILGSFVCDLIYEAMAVESGYTLTDAEKSSARQKAEQTYKQMTERQKEITGLTVEIVTQVEERKVLVVKFASEYFENVNFIGYEGYREELVSYAGDYYKEKILPQHEIKFNDAVIRNLKIGRITINYN